MWNEYKFGLNGPSIEFLDSQYGTKWRNFVTSKPTSEADKRKTDTAGQFYRRRMVIINHIKQVAREIDEDGSASATWIMQKLTDRRMSVDSLRKEIEKNRRNGSNNQLY